MVWGAEPDIMHQMEPFLYKNYWTNIPYFIRNVIYTTMNRAEDLLRCRLQLQKILNIKNIKGQRGSFKAKRLSQTIASSYTSIQYSTYSRTVLQDNRGQYL